MFRGITTDVDFIEELRMRRWARENYVPATDREDDWHPVILDEMARKDVEQGEADMAYVTPVRC